MAWTITAAKDLTPSQLSAWDELLRVTPQHDCPFYRPGYVQLVSTLLPNIEIAMLHDGGELRAIFPFERGQAGEALPIGRELADYQGPIHSLDRAPDVKEMLRASGLKRWDFDHLFPCVGILKSRCWTTWESPQIDLSEGAAEYLRVLFSKHKQIRRNMPRRERKLSREVGDVRVEFRLTSEVMVDRLLAWKIDQYETAGRRHPFHRQWIREFLIAALGNRSRRFRGNLAALFAGDNVIAMEYTVQSETTSHVLINSYDPKYSAYSPGMLCTLKMVEACERAGITKIDLGKGIESYKQALKNSASILGEGSVDSFVPRAVLRRSVQRSRYRFLRSTYSAPAKQIARYAAARMPFVRQLLSMR